MPLQNVLEEIDRTVDQSATRLLDFLKIQSISTDRAYNRQCHRAAEWLVSELTEIGFEASARPTSGHPIVVGRSPECGSARLFYGHYDVQPVDPLEKWEHPPFSPHIEKRDAGVVIRGRGASDDKGQLMTFIEACRAWKNVVGKVPSNLKFLIEGEEESGSPSLVPFIEENAVELSSEIALICDTGLFDHDTPAIVLMLRGILCEELTIEGPNIDLHSGMYGGLAANPIKILTNVLANLHDNHSRIAIPGFYDDVISPPPKIIDQWKQLGDCREKLLAPVGLSQPAGETDRTPLEMIWARPACDVNGVNGGYTGDGFKTVIPSQASAKVSFRLVNGQHPAKIREQFRKFVRSLLPVDVSVKFTALGSGPASCFSTEHPLFSVVKSALSEEWPANAVYAGCGGSIPVAAHFKEVLGIDSVLAGFGQDDDRIHSPNEKYDLRSFHLGIRTWARVIGNSQLESSPTE